MASPAEPWSCPRCGREFGRANRPHTCIPALSPDEYFAGRAPEDRLIFAAVSGYLRELGPVIVEAVYAGIFFKRSRIFATLRPRRRGFALSFMLSHLVESPRIKRTQAAGTRVFHTVEVHHPEDFDAELQAWLAESLASDS